MVTILTRGIFFLALRDLNLSNNKFHELPKGECFLCINMRIVTFYDRSTPALRFLYSAWTCLTKKYNIMYVHDCMYGHLLDSGPSSQGLNMCCCFLANYVCVCG